MEQEMHPAAMGSGHGFVEAFQAEDEGRYGFDSASDSNELSVVDVDETRATQRKASSHRVKAERVKKAAEEGASRMHETIATSVGQVKARFPPRTKEQFYALLPGPSFDGDWTEEEEAVMRAELEATPQWRDLLVVKDITVGVWKFFFRFTGRLVTDVIGLDTGLVYEGRRRWPDTFIRPLHVYLCLPFMRGDVMKLRLALQWAVICRNNDRRRHYLNGCQQDIFLRVLAEMMYCQDGTVEPEVLRRVALRIYMAKFGAEGGVEPEWSVLMGRIEARLSPMVFRQKPKPPMEDISAPDTYEVTTSLLGAVIEVVEDLTVFSFRSYVHAQTVKDVTSLARAVNDRPLKDDVAEAIKAILFAEERGKRLQSRAADDSPRVPA